MTHLIGHVRRQTVAYVALFVALGGTSYAATQLPSNSVGNAQLQRAAVTASKVKAGSLLARDFKRGQLSGTRGPAGRIGPKGDQGPKGDPGTPGANGTALGYATVKATGLVVASASRNVTSGDISTIPGAPGYYCIAHLSFTPGTANATAAFVGSDTDAGAQVELASADPNFTADTGCPPGTQALVFTHQTALPKAEPFYVSFS